MPKGNSRDLFRDVKNLNLGHLATCLAYSWREHKIIASITYFSVVSFFGVIGFGGATYFHLQAESHIYQKIKTEYTQLLQDKRDWITKEGELKKDIALKDLEFQGEIQKQKIEKDKTEAELKRKIFELEQKANSVEDVARILSELKFHLAESAYTMAALISPAGDIHDPEVLRTDGTAWRPLLKFSDFFLTLQTLIERIPSLTSTKPLKLELFEGIFYASLRGKYYEAYDAFQKGDFFHGENLRSNLIDQIEKYDKYFPEKKHYTSFMKGIYHTLSQNPDFLISMRLFDDSIEHLKKEKEYFWPAPFYQKIIIYEKIGDIKNYIKHSEDLIAIFKEKNIINHQIYLLASIALIEGYIISKGPESREVKNSLKEFKVLWNDVKNQEKFQRYISWSNEVLALEEILPILSSCLNNKDIDYEHDLRKLDSFLEKTEYYKLFILMLKEYISSEKLEKVSRETDRSLNLLNKLANYKYSPKMKAHPRFLSELIKQWADQKIKGTPF